MQKINGKTKWFNPEKGYGFITSRDGKDYFFPKSSLANRNIDAFSVGTGDLVLFRGQAAKKGPRAIDVHIVESAHNTNKRVDDRIVCPSCGKKIVPRMIFEQGRPSYSVCPFCGKMVKDFSPPPAQIGAGVAIFVFGILIFFALAALLGNINSNSGVSNVSTPKKIESKETTQERLISQTVNKAQALTQKIKLKKREKDEQPNIRENMGTARLQ